MKKGNSTLGATGPEALTSTRTTPTAVLMANTQSVHGNFRQSIATPAVYLRTVSAPSTPPRTNSAPISWNP